MADVEKGMEPNSSNPEKRSSGITVRSALIGLVCMLLLALTGHGTLTETVPALNIPEPGLAFVVVFIVLGVVLSRIGIPLKLTQAELLVVYVASGIGSLYYGLAGNLITVMQAALAQMTNAKVFAPVYGTLSKWAVPDDLFAVTEFWMGGSTGVPWSVWARIMVVWFIPFFSLYLLGASIAVLFRRKWDEEEHLAFPVAQATQSILVGDYGGDKNVDHKLNRRMFFVGGLIPLVIIGSRILNLIWPGIPAISGEIPLAPLFPRGTAWNSGLQGWPTLYFRIEPISIGLFYLVPLDITFSAWFFWIVTKLTQVYAFAKGVWTAGQDFMIFHPVGAYLGLGAYLFWLNRVGIRDMVTAAIDNKEHDDSPMSPRIAVVLFLAALVVLCLFLTFVLQVQIWWSLIYCVMIVLFFTSFFRLRAEAARGVAAPTHVPDVFRRLFGLRIMGSKNAGGIGLMYGTAGLGSVGVSLLEGWRLADELKTRKRDITYVLLCGFILVYVFTFAKMLPTAYAGGAAMFRYYPRQLAQQATERMLTGDIEASSVAIVSTLLGAGITFLLMFLRTNFLRWPLHPVGYALGWQYDVGFWYWSSFLIAWLVKLLVLRYGGNKIHKMVLPFMYGMIVCGIALEGVRYIVSAIV